MNIRVALVALAALQAGCVVEDDATVLQVQVCLEDSSGIESFKDTMRQISQEAGMLYEDASETTQMFRDATAARTGYPVIHLGGSNQEGVGFVVLSLSAYEVYLSFYRGTSKTNVDNAQRFASAAVRRIDERWNVIEVPLGRSAVARADCPASASDSN